MQQRNIKHQKTAEIQNRGDVLLRRALYKSIVKKPILFSNFSKIKKHISNAPNMLKQQVFQELMS